MGIRLSQSGALTIVDPAFLRRTARGVTIDLRVHPRSRRTVLELSSDTLKAQVSAAPADGKANDAVIVLLASEWRLPRSSFVVIKGAAARRKTVSIAGQPEAIAGRIADWMKSRG